MQEKIADIEQQAKIREKRRLAKQQAKLREYESGANAAVG